MNKVLLVSDRGNSLQAESKCYGDKNGRTYIEYIIDGRSYPAKVVDTPAISYGVLTYKGERWMTSRTLWNLARRVEW